MSNEIKENPIFASSFVSKFTHYSDVDADLRENIEMETIKDISFVILPIVDQVPEKARGIVRIFVTNNTGQPITLSIRYSIIGWYSDLSKKNKSTKLGTIEIKPREVWFRDISFVSSIKQGKNYIKLLFMQKREEYATTHIEYSQIRAIEDLKQIERSNFLGTLSKAYINPHSLNYWIYYSIFGPHKYRKEHTFLLVSKIFSFVAGGILLGLSYPFTTTTTSLPIFVLPISIVVILISILSFFSDMDASKVKLIKELELADQERKGSLEYAINTNESMLKKFVRNDMNFAFDSEKNTIHWKEGANKLYQRLVPDVGNMIGLPIEIGDTLVQTRAEVAVIEDKNEFRKKISKGIELQHEEGIRLRGVVEAVAEGSEGVYIDAKKIDSNSSIKEEHGSIVTVPEIKQDIDPITTVPDIKQDIDPIETKPEIEQKIEPIISDTSIDKEIEPIVTKTKSVEDARGYIGEPTDVETIPVPKDIPGHMFKTADKKSVKDIKKDEE